MAPTIKTPAPARTGKPAPLELSRAVATQRPAAKTEAAPASGATVGYEAQLWQMADALRGSDFKADFILANPPFNVSDWGGERLREDKRWVFGTPPVGNANFAWVQHIIHHLAPTGVAGFVLANGSMSSKQFRHGHEVGLCGRREDAE